MQILLDTHFLIWHAFDELEKNSPKSNNIVYDLENELYFSSVSLWEIAIKSSLNKPNFNIDVKELEDGLIESGFKQLYISNQHIFELSNLAHVHKDPFDRLLIAQAKVENFHFLTVDEKIILYPFDFIINAS